MASGLHPTLQVGAPTAEGQAILNGSGTAAPGVGAGAGAGRPQTTQSVGGALVPYRDPGPGVQPPTSSSRATSARRPTRPNRSIAVDPNDPEHLVLGTIDYNFPSNSSYVSLDGGETWEGPFHVPLRARRPGQRRRPGARLRLAPAPRLHDRHLHRSRSSSRSDRWRTSVQVSSISVARSEDGGFTWPETISSARSRVTTDGLTPDRFGRLRGNLSIGFLDKPWIAVGPDPGRPDQGRHLRHLHRLRDRRTRCCGWARSRPSSRLDTDPPSAWSAPRTAAAPGPTPVAVSPTVRPGVRRPGRRTRRRRSAPDRTVQGSQPAVAPDGTVTVAWLDSTDDESDEGRWARSTSPSPRTRARRSAPRSGRPTFNEIGYRPRNAFFRFWGSRVPAARRRPPDGELYIAYAARPADDPARRRRRLPRHVGRRRPDLVARPSASTTTTPTRAPVLPVASTWRPTAPSTRCGATCATTRPRRAIDIYYTASTDGGETWGFQIDGAGHQRRATRASRDFAVEPQPGLPRRSFLGDYFSLAGHRRRGLHGLVRHAPR